MHSEPSPRPASASDNQQQQEEILSEEEGQQPGADSEEPKHLPLAEQPPHLPSGNPILALRLVAVSSAEEPSLQEARSEAAEGLELLAVEPPLEALARQQQETRPWVVALVLKTMLALKAVDCLETNQLRVRLEPLLNRPQVHSARLTQEEVWVLEPHPKVGSANSAPPSKQRREDLVDH
jgi:hypothetical protein